MPELPEVETVRCGLAPVLEGVRLARVEARRPDLRFPLPPDFVQALTGATIVRLERRAKYLLGHLDRAQTLVMHLGMSGRFEISQPQGQTRPGRFHYAPDLNPWDEGGWHHLKNVQMRNLVCRDLEEVHEQFHLAVGRLRHRPGLVRSFFAQAGLKIGIT